MKASVDSESSCEGEGPSLEDLLVLPLPEARRAFDRAWFARLLRDTGGNISEAARRSGYSRQGLRALLVRLRLRSR